MKTLPSFVYYLRVTLEDSKPLIWRDVLVPSNLSLEDLHYVIQTTMGWRNCHLHQFIANRLVYSDYENNIGEYDRHESEYTLAQLLSQTENHILYEYDFGDSWLHKIELKKILPVDDNTHYPRCIKGRRACPPEDCGGIWGYTDILETLEQADDYQKEQMFSWLGEHFNPEHFDINMVNKLLEKFVRINSRKDTMMQFVE